MLTNATAGRSDEESLCILLLWEKSGIGNKMRSNIILGMGDETVYPDDSDDC